MQCSKCGTTVQVSDRFCEECGTPLITISKSTPGCAIFDGGLTTNVVTPLITVSKSTPGCEKCGAGSEEIDADGFCSNCGFRRENRQDDRFEVVRSPNLAGITDRGLKHHRNEDDVACAQIDNRNAYVLVVCDGVSSSSSPELAAKAAAESACRRLNAAVLTRNSTSLQEAMKLAIAEAMTSVCAIPYTKITDTEPPSTTIVAVVVVEGTATIGWLGDSRAYWISSNGSRQLTNDDSWLNDVVSSGKISAAEARKSPHAHAITRWLGADAMNMEPSIVNFDLPGCGNLLL